MNDLGRRIRAACAYAGFQSTRSLAERIGLQAETLHQIEIGALDLEAYDREAIISGIAAATGLPEGFFVGDLQQLNEQWEPAADKLANLETQMEDMLARIELLTDRAEQQLQQFKALLDQIQPRS